MIPFTPVRMLRPCRRAKPPGCREQNPTYPPYPKVTALSVHWLFTTYRLLLQSFAAILNVTGLPWSRAALSHPVFCGDRRAGAALDSTKHPLPKVDSMAEPVLRENIPPPAQGFHAEWIHRLILFPQAAAKSRGVQAPFHVV